MVQAGFCRVSVSQKENTMKKKKKAAGLTFCSFWDVFHTVLAGAVCIWMLFERMQYVADTGQSRI